jgi:hypothetical protein
VTARNERVQARYDALMREGSHGHYETLFRVVREECETADAIVSRIWNLLGSPTYDELKGRSIYDCIIELRTERDTAHRERDEMRERCAKWLDDRAAALFKERDRCSEMWNGGKGVEGWLKKAAIYEASAATASEYATAIRALTPTATEGEK